jgi:hypothetical protein
VINLIRPVVAARRHRIGDAMSMRFLKCAVA